MDDLQNQIDKLQKQIDALMVKRIYQQDVTPQALKVRHFGEGNPYFYAGLSADRPTTGNQVTSSTSCWFSTDTGVLSIWNGTQWKNVTLS